MKALTILMLSVFVAAAAFGQDAAKAPASAPTTSPAAASAPAEVEAAKVAGLKFLVSRQQADGSWADDPKGFPGGATGLAAWAMIANGIADEDVRAGKAIDYLMKLKTEKTYTIAIRANVWACPGCGGCGGDPKYKAPLTSDVESLYKSSMDGAYSYLLSTTCPIAGDQSNGHYAVMGVAAGAAMNIEVPKEFWQALAKYWLAEQNDDGGWAYSRRGTPSTPTMTAAGVYTMAMCLQQSPKDAALTKARDRGLEWMDKHFAESLKDPQMVHYYLLAVQHMGEATGSKEIGGVDWAKAITKELLARQAKDGSWEGPWGKDVATAYALITLGKLYPREVTQPPRLSP